MLRTLKALAASAPLVTGTVRPVRGMQRTSGYLADARVKSSVKLLLLDRSPMLNVVSLTMSSSKAGSGVVLSGLGISGVAVERHGRGVVPPGFAIFASSYSDLPRRAAGQPEARRFCVRSRLKHCKDEAREAVLDCLQLTGADSKNRGIVDGSRADRSAALATRPNSVALSISVSLLVRFQHARSSHIFAV